MRPPPSTRFTSDKPVSMRIPSRVSTDASGTARAALRGAGSPPDPEGLPAAPSSAGTSVKPFHVPHSGHRPSHRGSWWLHVEHSNTVFDFATRASAGENSTGCLGRAGPTMIGTREQR